MGHWLHHGRTTAAETALPGGLPDWLMCSSGLLLHLLVHPMVSRPAFNSSSSSGLHHGRTTAAAPAVPGGLAGWLMFWRSAAAVALLHCLVGQPSAMCCNLWAELLLLHPLQLGLHGVSCQPRIVPALQTYVLPLCCPAGRAG